MTRMVAVARRHPRSHRRSRSQRGLGGSSYIDSVVLRDRDADTSWRSAGDGTLEERRYYAQNWRADVSVILPSTGCDASSGPGILEWVKYSAYGVPQAFSMADYNRDGAVNGSDFNGTTGAFDVDYAASDLRADVNFDGGVTIDDYLLYINAAGEAAGRGTQSCASTANRIGYAGYAWDPVIGANHVRHRVYLPELGRWTRRDPLGYVDGMSVYEYVASMPIDSVDPDGLECRRYNRCSGDGPVNPPSGGNRDRRQPPVGGVEPGPGIPPPPPPPPYTPPVAGTPRTGPDGRPMEDPDDRLGWCHMQCGAFLARRGYEVTHPCHRVVFRDCVQACSQTFEPNNDWAREAADSLRRCLGGMNGRDAGWECYKDCIGRQSDLCIEWSNRLCGGLPSVRELLECVRSGTPFPVCLRRVLNPGPTLACWAVAYSSCMAPGIFRCMFDCGWYPPPRVMPTVDMN
jgi:RHS repeat-associated protein